MDKELREWKFTWFRFIVQDLVTLGNCPSVFVLYMWSSQNCNHLCLHHKGYYAELWNRKLCLLVYTLAFSCSEISTLRAARSRWITFLDSMYSIVHTTKGMGFYTIFAIRNCEYESTSHILYYSNLDIFAWDPPLGPDVLRLSIIAEILFHSLSNFCFSLLAPILPRVFLPSFILTPYWNAAFGKASLLDM